MKARVVKLMPESKPGRPKTHNLTRAQYTNEWRKKKKAEKRKTSA